MQANSIYNNNPNIKPISQWQQEDVSNWLKNIKLTNYMNLFQNINGYDLCFVTKDELINDFKLTKLHDRNLILKSRRELILEQCKHNCLL